MLFVECIRSYEQYYKGYFGTTGFFFGYIFVVYYLNSSGNAYIHFGFSSLLHFSYKFINLFFFNSFA